MGILRVIEPFADFSNDPNGKLYPEGMLVRDDDSAAVKWPHRFEPVEAAAHRATETAVSAPGLRRSITRPEKPARHHGRGAAKSDDKPAPAKKAAAKRPAKKAAAKKAAAPAAPPSTDSTEKL